MSAPSAPPLTNVQALRAIAALLVACVHVFEQSKKYDHPLVILGVFQNWGDSGVDIFFVISGFIMVYIQRQRPSSAVAFLAHRLYRVVPFYWGLTLLYIALYLTWPQLFGLATVDVARVVQTMSFTTFLAADSFPVLYLGWTLEYEMFFYVAFAVALLAGTVTRAVAISSGLIIFGFLMLPLEAVVLEFVLGCALGLAYDRAWLRRRARTSLLVGALLLAVTIVDPALAFEYRPIFWGVPAVLLVAGAINVRQIRHPVPNFLGDASYSIYLIQVFTISAYYKAANAMAFPLPNDVHALLCLALTTAAGCLAYVWIEKPLIELRRQDFRPLRRLARGVTSAMPARPG